MQEYDMDGLIQDCIAIVLELLQSCAKPSVWYKVGTAVLIFYIHDFRSLLDKEGHCHA